MKRRTGITLVSKLTVKAAVLAAELQQLLVRLVGRPEDKHAGVEAVGPTGIRRRGQLLPLKQLVHVGQNLNTLLQISAVCFYKADDPSLRMLCEASLLTKVSASMNTHLL